MGRSSIGWRRSATSNTVSDDNTGKLCRSHRKTRARKVRTGEDSLAKHGAIGLTKSA